MIHVDYIDGSEDDFETRENTYDELEWSSDTQCFCVPGIDGDIFIPRDFVKCIRCIKVEVQNC